MIIDLILLVLQGFLNILLLPLTAVNMAVDLVSSIPIIAEFLQIVAYVLPWGNLLPLILIIFSLGMFKIGVALVKTIWDLIPLF